MFLFIFYRLIRAEWYW